MQGAFGISRHPITLYPFVKMRKHRTPQQSAERYKMPPNQIGVYQLQDGAPVR